MHKIKKEGSTYGVVFIFGRQHTLCYITTTTRFTSRIPATPPLYCKRNNKKRNKHFCIRNFWNKSELIGHIRMANHRFQTTYFWQSYDIPSSAYGTNHRDKKQYKIGIDHPFKTAYGAKKHGNTSCNEYCKPAV